MKLKNLININKFKKAGPEKWIIIAVAGILIIVLAIPSNKEIKEEESMTAIQREEEDISSSYESDLEDKLAELLSKIDGVGTVNVMITLEESEEIVFQTDSSLESSITEETDSAGGQRIVNSNSYSYTTVLSGDSSKGEPYVIKQIYPKIAGVVVIAEGAEGAGIQTQISEAVQALFDIPVHKIKVLKASK